MLEALEGRYINIADLIIVFTLRLVEGKVPIPSGVQRCPKMS